MLIFTLFMYYGKNQTHPIPSSYCQSYVTADLNVTLLIKYNLHPLVLVYCYKYV
jgi:hypothetical protein